METSSCTGQEKEDRKCVLETDIKAEEKVTRRQMMRRWRRVDEVAEVCKKGMVRI